MSDTADITVIGGGVVGSAIGYGLARRGNKMDDAAFNGGVIYLTSGHEPQDRPGGLRRGAGLALTAALFPVGGTVFAPATVGVLVLDQPIHRAADVRLFHVFAGGVQGVEHRPGE